MLTRRTAIAASGALLAVPSLARAQDDQRRFAAFVAGIEADARRQGIRAATLDRAFAGVSPNAHVLELDRHQPEFTLTWAQYRARIVTQKRIDEGRQAARANARALRTMQDRTGTDTVPVLGIWGLESNYGRTSGSYGVVEALATLAYDGRRAAFFRGELIAALKILDKGDVSPGRMTGSYAGAMGQPQFMPSSYLRYAVDVDGTGRRDIWTSTPDVLASIGNYLARSGWQPGAPWGQPVRVPADIDVSRTGRDARRSLGAWMTAGVRRSDGSAFSRRDVQGAVLLPDGAGGDAFMVYANFAAIRRYNPSDFYALAVGLIGDRVVA